MHSWASAAQCGRGQRLSGLWWLHKGLSLCKGCPFAQFLFEKTQGKFFQVLLHAWYDYIYQTLIILKKSFQKDDSQMNWKKKVLILNKSIFSWAFKKSLKKYLQFYEFFQKVNIIAICVSNVWVSFWAWNMYLRQGRCLLKIWEKENQK